ncbi:MAG: hypothetical protein WAO58_00660 [Fimbriimonadaceae bacterium]
MPAIPSAKLEHFEPPVPLTQRRIFKFFLPLALSWIFMAFEAPIAHGFIGRLPNAEINLAAWYLIFTVALWVESPVIDLLATSTTLSKNHQHYVTITRFTQLLMLWASVIHAIFALPPVFDFIMITLLNADPRVAAAGHTAFAIMIPWSALIGWRRYLQGILIRYDMTRWVGYGTAVRVCTVFLTGGGLYMWSALGGAEVAAIAIVASVGAECLFAHIASRPAVSKHLAKDAPTQESPLTFAKLARFHLPLTATTMIMMLAFPLIGRALNEAPDRVESLAAWNITIGLLFMMRSITFALTEVVITLADSERSIRQLRRFCLYVGLFMTVLLGIVTATHLDENYFRGVIQAPLAIAVTAHVGVMAALFTPFIGAVQSYVRGMLTAQHLTASRLTAVVVGTLVLAAMLLVGVRLGWPGMINAGAAITVSMAAELAILGWSWTVGSKRRGEPATI